MSYDNGGMTPQQARDMDFDNMSRSIDGYRGEIKAYQDENNRLKAKIESLSEKLENAYKRLDDIVSILQKPSYSLTHKDFCYRHLTPDAKVLFYRE